MNSNIKFIVKKQIDINDYALILRKNINLPSFFAMCENTKSNLNSPCDRFIKGNLREEALELFSNGRLKHVNEIGRDNRDIIENLDLEYKTTDLFTETNRPKKFISARLKNTMGNNSDCSIKNPADFYIFGGEQGLVICDYNTMIPYLYKTNDALLVKIPFNKVTKICYAKEVINEIDNLTKKTKNVDYIKLRKEMHKQFMSQFI